MRLIISVDQIVCFSALFALFSIQENMAMPYKYYSYLPNHGSYSRPLNFSPNHRLDIPRIWNVHVPNINMPHISLPYIPLINVKLPTNLPANFPSKINLNNLNISSATLKPINLPTNPSIAIPAEKVPEVSLPVFPAVTFAVPEVDIPAVPAVNSPAIPQVSMPVVPAVTSFAVPEVDIPAVPASNFITSIISSVPNANIISLSRGNSAVSFF